MEAAHRWEEAAGERRPVVEVVGRSQTEAAEGVEDCQPCFRSSGREAQAQEVGRQKQQGLRSQERRRHQERSGRSHNCRTRKTHQRPELPGPMARRRALLHSRCSGRTSDLHLHRLPKEGVRPSENRHRHGRCVPKEQHRRSSHAPMA